MGVRWGGEDGERIMRGWWWWEGDGGGVGDDGSVRWW